MKRLLLGLTTLVCLAGLAFTHGGDYRPPSGEVPPSMRKPTDPPPPDQDPTPTPPPDDGGGTPTPPERPGSGQPPPDGAGPGTSGRNIPKAPGAGGQGAGPTTRPGGRGGPVRTFDAWDFWWSYNDDDILNLNARLKARENGAATSTVDLNVGKVFPHEGEAPAPDEDKAIREQVVPALEAALALDLHFDIRAGAAIALGKIGATQPSSARGIAVRLMDIMNNVSGKEHYTVEESAALALGLLQNKDEQIVNALCDRLLDRKGTPNARTRAFAALALGLLRVGPGDASHDTVVSALREAVASDAEAMRDVPVCALMAMGLSGDATFSADLVAMLKTGKAYRTRKLADLERSYAALALGKIAENDGTLATAEVVDVLKRAAIGRGNLTVTSAVIALGQIGRLPDVESHLRTQMASVLSHVARKGKTTQANFAMIALGRMGAVIADPALRGRIFDVLHREMTKGTYTGRQFGALGLGLMSRSGPGEVSIREAVREEFLKFSGDGRSRGAYAIALGMLRDRKAVPALMAVLKDRCASKVLRGHCAVALGMIGDRQAEDVIMSVLGDDNDPELRMNTAVAAGLVCGRRAIPVLIDILRNPRSGLFVQGSVSLALGRIGDRKAIAPLTKILSDDKCQDLNRALAAVALGLLGDRSDLPILSRLSRDINYRALVNSVSEVLSIL
jgi:HEAT repeat protein